MFFALSPLPLPLPASPYSIPACVGERSQVLTIDVVVQFDIQVTSTVVEVGTVVDTSCHYVEPFDVHPTSSPLSREVLKMLLHRLSVFGVVYAFLDKNVTAQTQQETVAYPIPLTFSAYAFLDCYVRLVVGITPCVSREIRGCVRLQNIERCCCRLLSLLEHVYALTAATAVLISFLLKLDLTDYRDSRRGSSGRPRRTSSSQARFGSALLSGGALCLCVVHLGCRNQRASIRRVPGICTKIL